MWLQFLFLPLLAFSHTDEAASDPYTDELLRLAASGESDAFATVIARLPSDRLIAAESPDGMTFLHWAAYHEKPVAVARLLEAGADPNSRSEYRMTPLSFACTNGDPASAAALLRAGADVNAALPGNETPLMTASRTGRSDVVELLLQHGAEVDAEELHHQTALMWAADAGHTDVVRLLTEAGADVNRTLRSGMTAMFFAARSGRTATVLALSDAGVDINQPLISELRGGRHPRNGLTALMFAVENGHFECALRLIDAGADPNDLRSGYAPLHALTWVRKPNRGDDPSGEPAPRGSGRVTSAQFIREVARRGADINLRLKRGSSGRGRLTQKGSTPFLMAADTADLEFLKILLELGADPDLTNADNCTPLLAAAGIGTYAPEEEAGTEQECVAAVRFLLGLGADVNHVDANGETAVHGAAYAGYPDVFRTLVDAGADVKIWHRENRYAWTPLLIAQGFRPGNFKPTPAMTAVIESELRRCGIEPPEAPPGPSNNAEYAVKKPKKD